MDRCAEATARRRIRSTRAWVVFVAVAVCAVPAAALRTDLVTFHNGDRLTGEVKSLERGRLKFKTDDHGTLDLEWDTVASIAASADFEIEMLSGDRIFGVLQPGPYAGALGVVTETGVRNMDALAVGSITRIGSTFLGRVDGAIDLGTSYTSASELFTLDLASDARYDRPGYVVSSSVNATVSTSPAGQDTRRGDVGVGFLGHLPRRWYYFSDGLAETNKELGFALRGSVAGGMGRYFVRNNKRDLLSALGLSFNRERPIDGRTRSNLELLLNLGYRRFSYDFPKIDVSVALTAYANLTDWGRTRLEFDAGIRREIVLNFYVTLRGYESYDSSPATEGAPNNDYGVTFALGWTF